MELRKWEDQTDFTQPSGHRAAPPIADRQEPGGTQAQNRRRAQTGGGGTRKTRSPSFPWGTDRVSEDSHLTTADRAAPDSSVRAPFPGEPGTSVRLGVKSGSGDVGWAQVTAFGAIVFVSLSVNAWPQASSTSPPTAARVMPSHCKSGPVKCFGKIL